MAFASMFSRQRAAPPPGGPPTSVGEALRLTLSLAPPSLNNSFHNVPGLGRVKSSRYRRWRREAGNELMLLQRAQPVKGPVFIAFELGEKGSRADADNLIKALLDLLVWLRLIEGDSKRCVRGYAVRWVRGARGIKIAVVADDA